MFKTLFLFACLLCALQSCKLPKQDQISLAVIPLPISCEASLRGLYVVNEEVVWASGSAGTVLLSTDGGTQWKDVSIPQAEINDFRSIHAWDEKGAIVFGVAGPDFAYKTLDGGNTWNVVYSDTTGGLFFNSVKFGDKQNGLAVSDPEDSTFFVLKTNDGGNTWQRVKNLPAVANGEANFAASNTCIEYLPSGNVWIASGGKAARVFYSDDFGQTWEVAKTPMVRGLSTSGIFSITFKNEHEGIIVGGIYDQPELNTNIAAYTVNGGKSWLPAVKMPQQYRSCVQFINSEESNVAFAIGKTGCDISFDGGINWQYLDNAGYYTYRSVPGKWQGFAAGANGNIVRINFN